MRGDEPQMWKITVKIIDRGNGGEMRIGCIPGIIPREEYRQWLWEWLLLSLQFACVPRKRQRHQHSPGLSLLSELHIIAYVCTCACVFVCACFYLCNFLCIELLTFNLREFNLSVNCYCLVYRILCGNVVFVNKYISLHIYPSHISDTAPHFSDWCRTYSSTKTHSQKIVS